MEIEIDREPLLPVQSLIGWDAASAGEETELLFSDREGGGGVVLGCGGWAALQ